MLTGIAIASQGHFLCWPVAVLLVRGPPYVGRCMYF